MSELEHVSIGKVTRLNWAIVLGLGVHFAATIWWASQITARLDGVIHRVQEVIANDIGRLERRIEKVEEWTRRPPA